MQVAAYPKPADESPASMVWVMIALIPLLLWDFSGRDHSIAQWMASVEGFPWQHRWVTARMLYLLPRVADAVLIGGLMLCALVPSLVEGVLSRKELLWWLGTTIFCLLLIVLMKRISRTSCPWSLAEFGGGRASYVSHWALWRSDGGPGGCFPSGHASTAFAFLPGWYVLRRTAPAAARFWLFAVLAVGVVVGISQTVRGAHYVSHSLWTAWICWAVSGASFSVMRRWRSVSRRPSIATARWRDAASRRIGT